MKPLLVSSGEPSGIGPDICLALASLNLPIVVLGDKVMLAERAKMLKLDIELCDYNSALPLVKRRGQLQILSLPTAVPVIAGQINPQNGKYVIDMLQLALDRCLQNEFSGLVTAPVHKAVINQANIPFTGHTEFLAEYCDVEIVVMMLACETMKVALVTTHLPLQAVPQAVTIDLIVKIIRTLQRALQQDFGLPNPRIYVAGLNPHAGEGGYLGREEIEVIIPALSLLRAEKIEVKGPFPADTMFTPRNQKDCDVFVAMYHDQGLPVLKYVGFGQAINITLGLPIIRTSVDHGTALQLAGTGQAESSSLIAAINMAVKMVAAREHFNAYN